MNNQPYNNDYETETEQHAQPQPKQTIEHTQEELDSIEYITPVSKKKKHKKHHSSSKDSTKRAEEIEAATDGFVFARPQKVSKKKHRKDKKRKWLKALYIFLAVILSIIIIAASTVFIYHQIGKSAMHDYDDMVVNPSPDVTDVSNINNNGKNITYKGKNYVFNEDVTSVVLMGIDKDDLGTVNGVVGTGGQADAIYIAVIDTKNNDVSVLGVSRDSMVDVNVYSENGNFINTENMQLCLSYAYGDGKQTSAENTITSLQRMFYGLQFDTYFAMDYMALQQLNDAIGGVTVTTNTDFYSYNERRTVKKGETITLFGADAEQYIRARDLSQLDSNESRMERQQQYITNFLSSVIPAAKNDLSVITKLYSTVNATSTTNLTTSKVTYLATTALTNMDSYKDIEFLSVPGTIKKGKTYAEFHVDQNGMMELMLDLFYEEVK